LIRRRVLGVWMYLFIILSPIVVTRRYPIGMYDQSPYPHRPHSLTTCTTTGASLAIALANTVPMQAVNTPTTERKSTQRSFQKIPALGLTMKETVSIACTKKNVATMMPIMYMRTLCSAEKKRDRCVVGGLRPRARRRWLMSSRSATLRWLAAMSMVSWLLGACRKIFATSFVGPVVRCDRELVC
jgi:hypothetical protein